MAWFNKLVSSQVAMCKRIDRALFGSMSVDGNAAFVAMARGEVRDCMSIADVGGGKTPMFSPADVDDHRLSVTGIDIDAVELADAPKGAYAAMVIGPIEEVRGTENHDLAIAQSVLEHVVNGRLAAVGMASFVKPGGRVMTFCPCRRAWFARLNLLLPERVKKALLFGLFPEKRERQGFPAYYDGCTPSEMRRNMRDAGIACDDVVYFFVSSYFMFCVPLYIFWRLLTYLPMKLWPDRYCETFIFMGRKLEAEPLGKAVR